jgi:transcriptional regulator GlxA family with amidase domain
MPAALASLSDALNLAGATGAGFTGSAPAGTLEAMAVHMQRGRQTLHLVRGDERSTSEPSSAPAARPAGRDGRIDRALSAMGAALHERWTVTRLARSVGMSRPAFALRFQEAVGTSPMRHLARCRMERAAELLAASEAPLAQVAELVGYESEFAFNRAFKRVHDVAPGAYRRRSRGAPSFRAAA